VKMELLTGNVSAPDVADGGYIQQELQVSNAQTYFDGYWVRAGIKRSKHCTGQEDTYFFWDCTSDTGYHIHDVLPNGDLNPDTYIGTGQDRQFVTITNVSGTSHWTINIAGFNAEDEGGSYTAIVPFSVADDYWDGLRSNCSSGHYGTSSNYSNCTYIQKSSDNGSTWSYASSQYAVDQPVSDPDNISHHGWTVRAQSNWQYRND